MVDYKKKPIVLYVTHYSELLGANRSLLSVVIAVKNKLCFEPVVLVPLYGALTKELEAYGIKYYVCHFRASTFDRKNLFDVMKGWLREVINISCALYFFYKFRNLNIALVHSNSSVLNVGAYLSVLLRVPHIWHFREFVKQHFHWSYNWGDSYQYWLYAKCSDYIVVISKSLGEYYKEKLSKTNIALIYNGVDIKYYACLSDEKAIFNIALVGIISPGKHQDIVIRAVAKLVNEYKIRNIHLHILGAFSEDQSYEKLIKRLIAESGILRNVSLHGYCNNVSEHLAKCKIGVLASEYEAFGRVTIEYMLSRLVPVVSNSGANIEIIRDGENGMIFELNNVEQLCEKILHLFNSPQLIATLSERAQLEARSKYTVEKNVEHIMNLYEFVCEKM